MLRNDFDVWVTRACVCVGLVAIFSLGSGCGEPEERVIYKDYPVEFDEDEAAAEAIGDPELIIGIFEEQLFAEIDDGGEVPLVFGTQGGIWVHISLRAFGVLADGEITAELGDGIGDISYPLKLTRSPEGFLEAYDIPIPVKSGADRDLGEIVDSTQRLRVVFRDKVRTIEKVQDVIIVGGLP